MNWSRSIMRVLLHPVARPALSRAVGRGARLRLPAPLLRLGLRAYVRGFGIDLADVERPLDDFSSFDDFFTRRLRPSARPIAAGDGVLVSPVDGKLLEFGPIVDRQVLQIKGWPYTVDELLGDPEWASSFDGGTFFTLYLSPRDYHRIHYPIAGEVLGYRYVPGALFPVNRLGLNNVPGLFARNERLTTFLRTPLGRVAVVKVGASTVGRITVSYAHVETNRSASPDGHALFYARPKPVEKGGDLGSFHLGSTVVLLVERPRLNVEPSLATGQAIRVGTALGRSPSDKASPSHRR